MFDRRAADALLGEGPTGYNEVEALHRRCGVYTKPEVVRRILDAVGWQSNANLSQSRLLEPAAGDGAFIAEAARRLVASCSRQDIEPTATRLVDRIRAFELHPREARRARERVFRVLREAGLHHGTAKACARSWIVNGDFLLTKRLHGTFTHAVGNPPYVRWSKIPPELKEKYERYLPGGMVGGDLFVPFLDRALDALKLNGRCGFLCTDRWRYMAFAESFRQKWIPQLDIALDETLLAGDAFIENVDSYPTILIAAKKAVNGTQRLSPIANRGKTLEELGYEIRVGPALGHTPAYVLDPGRSNIPQALLRPWLDGSEIADGKIQWRRRHVIVLYDRHGKLVDPYKYPSLKLWLDQFREPLEERSIVINGAPWYRPIDRVFASDWIRPKLLIPELAKVPRLAIDRSGAIPSHGVYAIFVPNDDVDTLYEKLRDGKLAKALENIAPKVKGGYVRCYRRFLLMVRI